MKSAEAPGAGGGGHAVIALPPRPVGWRREELEFLPAALEIIETPASPAARAIAATIMLFFVLALAWACLGKVDIIATANGRIIPSGRTKVIQPFETGVVRTIRVSDGQAVRAGDVLIELDPTANAADEARLTHDLAQDKLDVARLSALIAGDPASFAPPAGTDPALAATSRQQMAAQADEQAEKLAGLDQQIIQKQAEASEVAATVEKIDAVLPMLRGTADIRHQLLEEELGSKLLYLDALQHQVEQERELTVQQHRGEETQAALAALQRQRGQATAEYRKGLLADLAKAQEAAAEHGEEARKAAQRRALQTLTAPVDGTVQQLAMHTIGGVVTPAEKLLVIVPRNTRLEIEATLANKDVGFVQAGQRADVKVETFNFTRYGLLRGTVVSISRDVMAPELDSPDGRGDDDNGGSSDVPRNDAARQAHEPAYVTHIALAETGLATEAGWREIEPGMAVTAEIKTGQRRVISYLASPLLRYRQEGLRER